MRLLLLTVSLLPLFTPSVSVLGAAEYQWSAEIPGVVSPETNKAPRAFLWIPPDCRRVRAVVLGQHNMLEEPILENPILRKTLADIGFAEVWVTPAFDGNFRFDQGAGTTFQAMMEALARESGYTELAQAPVVPIGHSAMASFPYHFAAWNPGRTLAAASIKGTWPDFRNESSPPWKDSDLDGVPLLFLTGEYEDANGRAGKAASFRRRHPQSPLTMMAEAGGGHFDPGDRIASYLAAYLRAAARCRLPENPAPDSPVALKPVDPATQGWLYDRWRLNQPAKAPPAPVADYQGDPKEALWTFDGGLARATEAYNEGQNSKKAQLLGYRQDGGVLPQNPKLHAQIDIPFRPVDDGLTFKLEGVFLDTVPEGRPVGWSGLPLGSPIAHATGGGPVILRRICGPVVKLSDDTFALRFDRLGFDNPRRSNEIWLLADHPGDSVFKRAVQQSVLHFPLRNKEGRPQAITFPAPPDQPYGTRTLPLSATSDTDAKVRFYVREGPAAVDGDTLVFSPLPPRAKFPVKVTVVAWQWGRSIEPRMQSAEPVEHTFLLTR